MHKMTATLMGVILLSLLQAGAQADSVSFSGIDDGGVGSATLNITLDGSTLKATLFNTSPLTLDDGTGVNAPGITGFGFSVGGSELESWTLKAGTETIGGAWSSSSFTAGISRELVFSTNRGINGALFNPSAATGKKKGVFSTPATLVLKFDTVPSFDTTSAFVRMQNVGLDGEGSLKLYADASHAPLPAALWMGLCMLGGMGAVGARRRRK